MKKAILNRFGQLEFVTKDEFKELGLGKKYVLASFLGTYGDHLYYFPKANEYKKIKSKGYIQGYYQGYRDKQMEDGEDMRLVDSVDGLILFLPDITKAKIFGKFGAKLNKFFFPNGEVEMVECSLYLDDQDDIRRYQPSGIIERGDTL